MKFLTGDGGLEVHLSNHQESLSHYSDDDWYKIVYFLSGFLALKPSLRIMHPVSGR